MRLRALARRIEHDGTELVEFGRNERTAEEIAHFGSDRLQPRCFGGLMKGGNGGRIIVKRRDARTLGEPKRERSDTAEQIGDAFCLAGMLRDESRQRGLAFLRRLQERAGRQRNRRLADVHTRRRALHDQFAMARQPCEAVFVRKPRQRTGLL